MTGSFDPGVTASTVLILSPFSKRGFMRSFANAHALAAVMMLLSAALLAADVDTKFHNAPASARAAKSPYAGPGAGRAGRKAAIYARLPVVPRCEMVRLLIRGEELQRARSGGLHSSASGRNGPLLTNFTRKPSMSVGNCC